MITGSKIKHPKKRSLEAWLGSGPALLHPAQMKSQDSQGALQCLKVES